MAKKLLRAKVKEMSNTQDVSDVAEAINLSKEDDSSEATSNDSSPGDNRPPTKKCRDGNGNLHRLGRTVLKEAVNDSLDDYDESDSEE